MKSYYSDPCEKERTLHLPFAEYLVSSEAHGLPENADVKPEKPALSLQVSSTLWKHLVPFLTPKEATLDNKGSLRNYNG